MLAKTRPVQQENSVTKANVIVKMVKRGRLATSTVLTDLLAPTMYMKRHSQEVLQALSIRQQSNMAADRIC